MQICVSTEKGYEVGLISKERYDYVCKKKELIDKEIERVSHVNIGARLMYRRF